MLNVMREDERSSDSLPGGIWNKVVEELAAKINDSFGATVDTRPEVAEVSGVTSVIGAVVRSCDGLVNIDDLQVEATLMRAALDSCSSRV
jgi:hypothetical protein